MKNSILSLFISLLAFGEASAAEVDASARREIGRTLTRIVAREVLGGYVKVQSVRASRGKVRIYASIGLSYYPFREENVRAMRDSVRALLPVPLRKARIELYTDRHEIGELVPMACRDPEELKRLVRRRKIVPFTNRSERPLVVRLDAPATPVL